MKLWKKIVLAFLAVIIVGTVAVAIWQWENISALYLYATTSGDEIAQMTEDAHKTKEEVLKKYDEITVSDLTPEQENAIISGEKTAEEVVREIEEKDAAKATAGNAEAPKGEAAKPVDKRTEIVNRYLKQIYAVKAEFLGKLGNMKAEAQAEFYKFPMKERTKANKTAVITDKIIECYELENQCDIKIDALLSGLKTELEQIGSDTAIVNEIRSSYEDEKSVKKAYYMSLAF